MARYKVLKSIAHSIGHSFTSCMNYAEDDYIMGHLLSRARETGENSLTVDFLKSKAEPRSLLTATLDKNIGWYCRRFEELVKSHKTQMKYISSATMTISFDLSVQEPICLDSPYIQSPFICHVTVVDDRGKKYESHFKDWWYPEEIKKKPWWQFWK